jgi:hypothetical protein
VLKHPSSQHQQALQQHHLLELKHLLQVQQLLQLLLIALKGEQRSSLDQKLVQLLLEELRLLRT